VAEFTVSAKLIADSSGLKAGLADGQKALERLTAEELRSLKVVSDLAQAVGGLGDATRQAVTPMGGLQRAFHQLGIAAKAQQKAVTDTENAVRRQQAAVRQLGVQMGDFGTQVASGINPMMAFIQQSGQMAYAAQDMGGKVGKVAMFLNTPWGAAVQFGALVLGSLVGSLLSTGREAEKAAGKLDFKRMSVKELTKAIVDLEAAERKEMQTSQQAADDKLRQAQGDLSAAVKTRDETRRLLSQALRTQERALLGGQDTRGSQVASQATGRANALRQALAAENENIKTLQKLVRERTAAILQREVKEQFDPAAKAAGDYERVLGRLNDQLTAGTINEAKYRQELGKATQQRERAIKAANAMGKAASSANREFGRLISSSEAASIVRGIGGQVNSADRSTARQTQLYNAWLAARKPRDNPVAKPGTSAHERGNALDVQFAPGLNPAKLRAAFQEEGVTLTKVFAERGHWHIEWAKGVDTAAQAAREAAKATRELEQAQQELERRVASIIAAFDPARAAADKYAASLAEIADLQGRGLISSGEALRYSLKASADDLNRRKKDDRALIDSVVEGGNMDDAWRKMMEGIEGAADERVRPAMERMGRAGAKAFQDEGLVAAEAIARLLGGKIGGAVGDAFGILNGLKSGNFNSVSGPMGSILSLLGGGKREPGEAPAPFTEGLTDFIKPIKGGLKDVVEKIGDTFSIGGDFEKTLGHMAGGAALGSVVGPAVTNLLGMKGSNMGAQIGGALGSAAGAASGIPGGAQIGALIGSIEGSIVGGLIKSAKRGSASITSATGDIETRGNSDKRNLASKELASSIQGALSQIADSLGGQLGAFAVSIGVRDDNFRVDPSGKGITKTKKGAVDFGQDEKGAISFAIANAIADGAVTGLSAAVQQALKSSPDIDKALREALKVREIEDLLTDLGGQLNSQFRAFDQQAAERVRIAKQYGFDVVKIEELNAKERLKLVDQVLASRVGALKDLLEDINFGDLFQGSLTDRRDRLITEFDKAVKDAEGGVDGGAERQADLSRKLLDLSKSTFGTAGGEFAADLSRARTSAERVIELENERIKQAQAAQQQTNDHLDEANSHLSEQTTIQRAMLAQLQAMAAGGSIGEGIEGSQLTKRQAGI
jgi:hypothetical protein